MDETHAPGGQLGAAQQQQLQQQQQQQMHLAKKEQALDYNAPIPGYNEPGAAQEQYIGLTKKRNLKQNM